MAKGRFNIKGTKDFLIAAVACTFLCLWSIRDAWFPTKNVLEKHPQSYAISMEVSGVIKSLPLQVGEEVRRGSVLATIYDESYRKAVEAAEAAFEVARETRDPAIKVQHEKLVAAREELAACTLKNTGIILMTTHGEEPLSGVVLEYLVQRSSHVEAGEPILLVRPKDNFYMFNKSLAVLSLIGMLVALFFHRVASR